MLTVIEKAPYRVVLCGKRSADERTVGKTKKAVFEDIACKVIPHVWEISVVGAGTKVQTQWKVMKAKHHELNTKLKQTGGGIGGNGNDELDGDALRAVELAQYIPGDGPNEQNTEEAKNQWDKNVKEYPIFPRLYALFHDRPNQVPIATTTGIGPNGPRMVMHQQPLRAPSLKRSSSLPPLPPRVPMPSPLWMLSPLPEWGVNAGPSAVPDIPTDSDSDFEILTPAHTPTPPVKGNGKSADPHERQAPASPVANGKGVADIKAKGIKTEAKAKEDVKPTKGKGKEKEKEKKGEVEVKDEKRTPPSASKKLVDAQASSNASSNSTGSHKRKSADETVLELMHKNMQERHAHLDAYKERELLESSYQQDMDWLREMRREDPNMATTEYNMCEDAIRADYGNKPLD
ncbi:hypothetical protein FS749_004459 [Ceratobasidium sp. UAMH 11750]|nr:hypothetical protein FS749_004459 [Ceratobasidium sp. UAMH 11750]